MIASKSGYVGYMLNHFSREVFRQWQKAHPWRNGDQAYGDGIDGFMSHLIQNDGLNLKGLWVESPRDLRKFLEFDIPAASLPPYIFLLDATEGELMQCQDLARRHKIPVFGLNGWRELYKPQSRVVKPIDNPWGLPPE